MNRPSEVKVGQIWESTDARRPRRVVVGAIEDGYAWVASTTNRERRHRIHLDRLCPKGHWQYVGEETYLGCPTL